MIMVHYYSTVIHDQTKLQMSFERIGWVFKQPGSTFYNVLGSKGNIKQYISTNNL